MNSFKVLTASGARFAAQCQPCNAPLPTWISRRMMSSMQAKFDEAKKKLTTLKEEPSNEIKLQMYALFKQSTIGAVNTKRPSMMDFVGRAKWDAWNGLKDQTVEQAQQAYADLVDQLAGAEKAEESAAVGQYKNLLSTCEGGLRTITLNRPTKKNAISSEMYLEWIAALEEADACPQTAVCAITGAGDFFCSGNDLSNFMNIPEGGPKQLAADSKKLLYKFVDAFIDFKKPLIGVINGPAVGVSVTLLGLYDAVYATDKAYFTTPFTRLGQSAEGCSSFTFPRIMGPATSTEMLLFNKKMTAAEAHHCGLVTEVFPHAVFQAEVWPKLRELAQLPKLSLIYGKQLVRDIDRAALKQANTVECERLEERWLSDECRNAVMAFLSKGK